MNDRLQIGGKAAALTELQNAGFSVPPFFVVLPDASGETILSGYGKAFPGGQLVAVRSSAVGEDAADRSFAGQFESYLFVKRGDLLERCRQVWNSGSGERVAAYSGKASPVRPAALIQRMIDADSAGVAFSADPVSGRRRIAVVSAVPGVGEGLVSGEKDADTWEVSRTGEIRRTANIADCLTGSKVREVAELARKAADHFGCPQDIEWAYEDGQLWLLQSRPITSLTGLPDPDGPHRIWDNSNIAESYSGVTTPLTYSFARRAYEEVYRQFCRLMGVPASRIEANEETFAAMIGMIRGRIYYNLVSWYRVLGLLPGFRLNRAYMEQMMGVKEPMPEEIVREIEAANTSSRWRDAWHLTRTVGGLIVQYIRLPRNISRFYARLDGALNDPPVPLERMEPDELLAHYRDLERQLLKKWDAPLVNDFFAMIFCGVLRKLTSKWCGDDSGALANELLRDIGDIVSLEPARRIREMAEKRVRDESIEAELRGYVEKFGDRCVEELKLESPTLRDDLTPLLSSIEALAARGVHAPPRNPETPLPGLPWPRRVIFAWVLSQARARVRDRENLRFERTRVFGRVRQIMRGLGRALFETPDDVFYLELDELRGHFDGTAPVSISGEVVQRRRDEFERYRMEPAPPDRFETFGSPAAYDSFEETQAPPEPYGDLRGMGACAGRVRGRVRVVTDPRGVNLEPGEILVAQQTDPGWVILFPAASGLLVERGSLLSHSAIVAREMGIPAIVSVPGITRRLRNGQEVEMDGATGVIRILDDSES